MRMRSAKQWMEEGGSVVRRKKEGKKDGVWVSKALWSSRSRICLRRESHSLLVGGMLLSILFPLAVTHC